MNRLRRFFVTAARQLPDQRKLALAEQQKLTKGDLNRFVKESVDHTGDLQRIVEAVLQRPNANELRMENWGAILRCLGVAGDLKLARRTVHTIRQLGKLGPQCFGHLLSGLAERGEVRLVNSTLQVAARNGFDIMSFGGHVLHVLGQRVSSKAVLQVFEHMVRLSGPHVVPPEGVLIGLFGALKEKESIIRLWDEYESHASLWVLNTAMASLVKINENKEAHIMMRRAEENGFTVDTVTHNIVLQAMSKEGRLVEEMEYYLENRVASADVWSRSTLINRVAKVDLERALKLFDQMLDLKVEPNTQTFASLIEGCRRTVNVEIALKLYADMEARGMTIAPHITRLVWRTLIASESHEDLAKEFRAKCEVPEVFASVDIDGEVHRFTNQPPAVGSPDAELLDQVLGVVSSGTGWIPDKSSLPATDLPQKKMEWTLRNHAEKQALAFLVSHCCLDQQITVSIRMCQDCHSFFCAASEAFRQRLSVRDKAMTHVFEQGQCSCLGEWL